MWVNCFVINQKNQIKMERIKLSVEREEELNKILSRFLPEQEMNVVNFDQNNDAEFEYDQIMLALGQDKDYRISYWDKDNKETHICLGAMNEMDAEDRFNSMFPDCIFICAKHIYINE